MTDHEHHHVGTYADAISAYREDKDAYFRSGSGSPIPAGERDAFAGLPYFPPDEAWIVDGLALESYEGTEPTTFQMPIPPRVAGSISPPLGPRSACGGRGAGR